MLRKIASRLFGVGRDGRDWKKKGEEISCIAFTWYATTRTNLQGGKNRGGQSLLFRRNGSRARTLRDKALRASEIYSAVCLHISSVFRYSIMSRAMDLRRRRRRLATEQEFYRVLLPASRQRTGSFVSSRTTD